MRLKRIIRATVARIFRRLGIGNYSASEFPGFPANLTLSSFSRRFESSHIFVDSYSLESCVTLGDHHFDDRLPSKVTLPPRFHHVIRGAFVDRQNGLVFEGARVVTQSGQVYLPADLEAAIFRISPPRSKQITQVVGGTCFVIPPIHAFYHWVCEFLPQVLWVLQKRPETRFILPPNFPDYAQQSLSFLNAETVVPADEWVIAEKIVMIDKPLFGFVGNVERELLSEFRNSVAKSWGGSEGRTRVYLSRRTSRRALPGEKEIEQIAESLGYYVFSPEKVSSFMEQVALFSRADIIAGPSGSGHANCVFMGEGTAVLDFFSPDFSQFDCITLCSSLGQRYKRIDLGNPPLSKDEVVTSVARSLEAL